jgi:hypothetical protein
VDKKTCLACGRKLRPQTSVPRWNEAVLREERTRKFFEDLKAKRAQEIAEGNIGYMGEAQFCGQSCAAFFGRCAAQFIAESYTHGPFVLRAVQKILSLYKWIADRKPVAG